MQPNCDHPHHHFPTTDAFLDFCIRENVPPLTHCFCGDMILIPDSSQPAGQPPFRPVLSDSQPADIYRALLAGMAPRRKRGKVKHYHSPKTRK